MDFYKIYLSRSDPWPPELMATFEGFNTELYGYMWGPSEFTATGTLQKYNREPELQIFEDSAHLTMLDEPDTYAEAIRKFLNKVDASR